MLTKNDYFVHLAKAIESIQKARKFLEEDNFPALAAKVKNKSRYKLDHLLYEAESNLYSASGRMQNEIIEILSGGEIFKWVGSMSQTIDVTGYEFGFIEALMELFGTSVFRFIVKWPDNFCWDKIEQAKIIRLNYEPRIVQYALGDTNTYILKGDGDEFFASSDEEAKKWLDALEYIYSNLAKAGQEEQKVMGPVDFIKKTGSGAFDGWKVMVQFTTDPEWVYIFFMENMIKQKRLKPNPLYVRRSKIIDFKENDL